MRAISLGFDFYGSGNIGDDLMLAGFLDALAAGPPAPALEGRSRFRLGSQQARFPQVAWADSAAVARGAVAGGECWAGVGDTPFQLTCGTWFLDYLLAELPRIQACEWRALVNVGAETEIQNRREDFARIASVFDAISVRDEHSRGVLVDVLKVPPERVFCAADLAHVTLARLSFPARKSVRLGVIVNGDTLSANDIRQVRDFIVAQPDPVRFIAQEVRNEPDQEQAIYARCARGLFSKFKRKATLTVPDYARGSIAELIQPIVECETLISSRYHGLLTGAWAGCKIAAIGRSSKVSALARELGVPYCTPPLTIDKISQLQREAIAVDPARLARASETARAGITFALSGERCPGASIPAANAA
jgi:hypothetical protein